jgi:hypothetical protein
MVRVQDRRPANIRAGDHAEAACRGAGHAGTHHHAGGNAVAVAGAVRAACTGAGAGCGSFA